MPAVIEVKDLGLRRDGRTVLQNVGFEIAPHELVGLIGPNGGGKTTLLQVLLGVLKPYQGKVAVLGYDPSRLDRIRGQIGYVAQPRWECSAAFRRNNDCQPALRPSVNMPEPIHHAQHVRIRQVEMIQQDDCGNLQMPQSVETVLQRPPDSQPGVAIRRRDPQ